MRQPNALKAPGHRSYKRHRRQFWTQIMLPVLLGALLVIVAPLAVWLIRMGGGGDVGRWAAISTMWLLVPVMIGLLLLFAILAAGIYLAGKLNALLPAYGLQAQRLADAAAINTQRATEMLRKPVLAVRAVGRAAGAQFKRLRERV